MTVLQKGLLLGALQVAIVLSVGGKLLYDRATRPRIWVQVQPYDPYLPIRGRYLSLRLVSNAQIAYTGPVLFFIPEHAADPTPRRGSSEELWAEVTIPKKGPPRPIRLGLKRGNGPVTPLDLR